MNRVLKSLLDKTRFAGCPSEGCEAAENEMSYEELATHLRKQCAQIVVKCTFACGLSFPREKWDRHFDQECPEVKVACKICGHVRPKAQDHDCIRDLKSQNQVLEAKVKELTALTEKQAQDIANLKEGRVKQSIRFEGVKSFKFNQQTGEMTCDLDKALMVSRVQGDGASYEQECDICERDLHN